MGKGDDMWYGRRERDGILALGGNLEWSGEEYSAAVGEMQQGQQGIDGEQKGNKENEKER